MNPPSLALHIRPYHSGDADAIVDLSLQAWAPVFASFREVLGPIIYSRVYPNWQATQREAVLASCTDPNMSTRVAVEDGIPVGFIVWKLDRDKQTGEVEMLAVHPHAQRRGVATRLNAAAMNHMREEGATVVEVWTGGDPGHAPARSAYERMGYTPLPLVHYYQLLE